MKSKNKELNAEGVIQHIQLCFAYAINQNHGVTSNLVETLLSIPNHLFGRHDTCKLWCQAELKGSQTVLLKEESLYRALMKLRQIATLTKEKSFSVCISPTKHAHPKAFEVTGLENRGGDLYCHEMQVDSVPIIEAFRLFHAFLLSFPSRPALLPAHNAKFDIMILPHALKNHGLENHFQRVIAGFADTKSFFHEAKPHGVEEYSRYPP